MAWTRQDFLSILQTSIANELLADKEIHAYVCDWNEDNRAALLHANNVTAESDVKEKKSLLQLVAAFARKDLLRVTELVQVEKVSTGARLDYLLPLHDQTYGRGEDVFVTSTKIILGGQSDRSVKLASGHMTHKVGPKKGTSYTEYELRDLENYVNNSFAIQETLQNAPNKAIIQPNYKAVEYILQQAETYKDTNQNPVIVFIPGAISIAGFSIPDMIKTAIKHNADINDVGFFGVPGIVWSIILADEATVNTFLQLRARTDIEDEMGNKSVSKWAESTQQATNLSLKRIITLISLVEHSVLPKQSIFAPQMLRDQVATLNPTTSYSFKPGTAGY